MGQPTVFISYSRQDEREKEALLTHLGGLQHAGLIRAWSDDQISAGANWEQALREAISEAKVAILLITANFLSSKPIMDNELPALMARREKGELIVVPVIARACAWKSIKWLADMRIRPIGGQPVWSSAGAQVDEYLSAITEEVVQLVTAPPVLNKVEGSEQFSISENWPEAPLPSPNGSHAPAPAPPNPFGDRGRITDPAHFFNREELLRQIFEELGKGANLSLVGESQIGKSSLLSMICSLGPERIHNPPEKIAYLSLEWVDDEDDFYEALCDALGIETCRGFKLTRALRDKRHLLCIDEIEKMTWDGFTVRVRSHLRGLADGRDAPLTLVVASRSSLAHLFPDSPELNSPLAGICRQVDVKPFSPQVVRVFLLHRLQGTGITFSERQVDELWAKSQGQPARLQQAAAILYHRLAQQAGINSA